MFACGSPVGVEGLREAVHDERDLHVDAGLD